MTVTYQIYVRVTAIYDDWTRERVIYIAEKTEYIWYVTAIYNVFYISNVSVKKITSPTRTYMSKNTVNNFAAIRSSLSYKIYTPETT